MDFFKQTLTVSPYITNIIWFTQVTPGDIKSLLTNNGQTMPSNVLGSEFTFQEMLQLLIWQKPPYKKWNSYILILIIILIPYMKFKTLYRYFQGLNPTWAK